MAATQTEFPGRATARTILQTAIGLAAMLPFLVADIGLDSKLPYVAGALAIAAAVTRIMSIPGVNLLLSRVGLGAEPKHTVISPTGEIEN